jgi:hypothetical protein
MSSSSYIAPPVSLPVLVSGLYLWPTTRFLLLSDMRSSCCGAPSLMRGRICNLLVQFSVTLGPNSRRTHDNILLSRLRLPTTHQVKVKVTLRPTDRQSVGQSVLMSGAHLVPETNFSFSLRFSLDSCWFVIL